MEKYLPASKYCVRCEGQGNMEDYIVLFNNKKFYLVNGPTYISQFFLCTLSEHDGGHRVSIVGKRARNERKSYNEDYSQAGSRFMLRPCIATMTEV